MPRSNRFQVSVTIPVYYAAQFVSQAVESALLQPQTAEVVLVEDYSPDNSWEVCQQLAAEHDRVHLYRHPDGRNHGCSASRTLAVQKSNCEYVAFLDADDYYLPDRFSNAEKMFLADPDLEGVYEAIKMHVEDDDGWQRWNDAGRSLDVLYTMTERIAPDKLFSVLVQGGAGYFHIDGLTVRRRIFEKIGYFNQALPLHMDEVFFIKAAAKTKLLPGRLDEPVAKWRVHDHNRISALRSKSLIYHMKLKYRFTVWDWGRKHLNQEQQQLLLKAMINEAKNRTRFNRLILRPFYGIQKRVQLMLLPFEYPQVLRESIFWSAFLPHPAEWLERRHKG